MNALIAFIHHAAAFVLVAALVAEHALFSPRPALRAGKAPELSPVAAKRIPLLIRLQLAAIAGAIFCAPFMAKGFA